MSVETAPSTNFPGIIYNPNFFTNPSGISLTYATANYLGRVGVPTSIATTTSFSGKILTNNCYWRDAIIECRHIEFYGNEPKN